MFDAGTKLCSGTQKKESSKTDGYGYSRREMQTVTLLALVMPI